MFTVKDVKEIHCGSFMENCFLITPPEVDTCFLIDPGDSIDMIERELLLSGRRLEAVLLTHGHFDHILAAFPLAAKHGVNVYLNPCDDEMLLDPEKASYDPRLCRLPMPSSPITLDPGIQLELCGQSISVLHTPGHSRGSVCYYCQDSGIVFTGDTLFRAGYGRTDLYGGSIQDLIRSLRYLLNNLPEDTVVYPGHDDNTRIGIEKRRYRL